jgi:hypothetical protein
MPSNRKSETAQKHTIPWGGVDTKLVAPDQILAFWAALSTEPCIANVILTSQNQIQGLAYGGALVGTYI